MAMSEIFVVSFCIYASVCKRVAYPRVYPHTPRILYALLACRMGVAAP